jgi:hypothetical protein
MRVALVGGINRLGHHYRRTASALGCQLRVFNRLDASLASEIRGREAIVIFTANISHSGGMCAIAAARSLGIAVCQSHSSGICALRKSLSALRASRCFLESTG